MKNPKNQNSRQYQTEKLIFAAYLIAKGKTELVGTKAIPNSRNVIFILSKSPSDDDITKFFNGSAMVSALRYAEAINTIKGTLYEMRRRNNKI